MTKEHHTQTGPLSRPEVSGFAPVGVLGETMLLGRSIVLDIAHKLLRQRRRDRTQVASDYDQGEWKQYLDAARWQTAPTLRDYLIPPGDQMMTVVREGRLQRVSVSDYYAFRITKLIDIIGGNDGGARQLVELGAGAGRNIFSLALAKRWDKLYGFDISPTGLQVAAAVKDRYDVAEAEFGPIDLLAESYADVPVLKGATIFTYLCLEQLPTHAEAVLRRLLDAGAVRGIHVEPSLEMLQPHRLRDLAVMTYIWRQDYQRGIVTAARKLEAEGLIDIVSVERLGYSPNIRYEPTLTVWQRRGA